MLVILLSMALLGLCLGSFVNALVWRVHEQAKSKKQPIRQAQGKQAKSSKQFSVVSGRSQCVHCSHVLPAKDLVPVLSWLALRGRCRYCNKPISPQYPLVELTMALVFTTSYIFWPTDLAQTGNLISFVTWLAASVGLLALLVYDLRWTLLPSKILYPTLLIAVTGQFIYLVGYAPNKSNFVLQWLLSLAVASGFFWLIFTISDGRWIGYGDVRLGLATGTLLAIPAKSFLMIFLASVIGILFVLPSLAKHKRDLSAKLPYAPFLIFATYFCLLFGSGMIDWYKDLILLK